MKAIYISDAEARTMWADAKKFEHDLREGKTSEELTRQLAEITCRLARRIQEGPR